MDRIKNKKVYIFDLDGTLVDSMSCFAKAITDFLDSIGAEYPDNIVEIITPMGYQQGAAYFKEHLGVNLEINAMADAMQENAYIEYRDKIDLKPGVYEFLKSAKKQEHSLYVLTASPKRMVEASLKRNGVSELFSEYFSVDDLDSPKSNPEIYKTVAGKIGCKLSDIAFFEDNIANINAANKAGVFTVGVYDTTGEGFKDRMKAEAKVFITSFCELN